MRTVETLRRARLMWPEVIDKAFLQRFIVEGVLTEEELNEILR